MSFIAQALEGKQIDSVWTDTEGTFIMLTNGTQITIRGLVVVEPVATQSMADLLSRAILPG